MGSNECITQYIESAKSKNTTKITKNN